jgi:hypothetical protein
MVTGIYAAAIVTRQPGSRNCEDQQEGVQRMKTLLGLAAIATLALALPASAAEHGKKHEANAKPAAMSGAMTSGAMAPATVKKETVTVKKSKP